MSGLALLKTYSLAGLAEGWDDKCKLVYRAVKYEELKALRDVQKDELTEDIAIERVLNFVKEHFVSGKAIKFDDDNMPVLSDMTEEDVTDLPLDTLTALFNEMNGGKLDPKGGEKAVQSETSQATSDLPTTTL